MPASGQSELPEYCQKPTLVLGCGNILFGDDGFGCALVDFLESHHRVPDDVCLLDAGTGVRKLLFTLCLSSARPQRLLVIDAFDAGRSPGELFELDPYFQSAARTAGELRGRSTRAGLSNRTAARADLSGVVAAGRGGIAARRGVVDERISAGG